VLKHLNRLWGYDVILESVDTEGDIKMAIEVNDEETLLDVFVEDDF